MIQNRNNPAEHGSAFFYIIIAIALFAALSYTVSKNRNGNTNIYTEEQAKLAAQEIIEYGNTVTNAVQKLRLRGCSDTDISFENNVVAGYSNGGAPADNSCDVFDTNGGNINLPTFNRNFYDPSAPAFTEISFNAENNITGVSSTEAELMAFVSRLDQNICDSINQILHDSNSFTDADGASVGSTQFTGAYNSSPVTLCDGTADGTTSGCCFESTGCDTGACYHFYQVLIPR